MKRDDIKKISTNLALAIITVLVILLLLEVALATNTVDYVPGGRSHVKYCDGELGESKVFHSEYGWISEPNSRQLVRQGKEDDWYNVKINENGFRDIYDSGNDTTIVLGDSFTYGHLVSNNNTYTQILDHSHPNRSFMNYGQPGYGTHQELLVYKNVTEGIDEDLVILQYYLGNDAKDNVRNRNTTPRFKLANSQLIQTDSPNMRQQSWGGTDYRFEDPLDKTTNFLYYNTEVYPFLHTRISGIVAANSKVENKKISPPTGQKLENQLSLTSELITNISQTARSEKAEVLLVPIPTRGQIEPSHPHHYSPSLGNQYYDSQMRMLRQTTNKNDNISLLYPKEELKDAHKSAPSGNPDRVYGLPNGHLTEKGHKILARETSNWMVRNNYVTDEKLAITTTKTMDCRR